MKLHSCGGDALSGDVVNPALVASLSRAVAWPRRWLQGPWLVAPETLWVASGMLTVSRVVGNLASAPNMH
eukprot:4455346-Pyramimonas_sp.AAC.1